jgi:hypothetical protein
MTEHAPDPDPAFGELHSEDAAALDALVTASFDAAHAVRTLPGGRERIERLESFLSLLDCDAESDRSLADVTFARLMQARGERLSNSGEPVLSSDDDAALERLVMDGFDAERVPGALRERARRHQRLMQLVTGFPVPASDDLAERTLARVQAHIDAESDSMRMDARPPRGFRFRIADLVSVAAVLAIGAGVTLPMLTAWRDQSRRTLCRAHLGSTASAMATYAGSNRDSLPVANASLGGGTWWEVGKPAHSNSANLFTLTKAGYVPVQALACPGNPRAVLACSQDACDWNCLDEVSYSYQIMFGPQKPEWRKGDAVILADRSPIIPQNVRGQPFDPFANTTNHKGSGQHLLRNDGSVAWTTSPILKNGDNIWLPRDLEVVVNKIASNQRRFDKPLLKGTETPEGSDDTFLGP